MQLLLDFFPLIAFYVSYKLADIYVATAIFIVATMVQIAVHWWRTRTIKTIHWVTAVLVLVFGSATLLLHDARYIQWKLTVLMWLLSAAFLVSHFVGAKPLTQRFLESALAEHLTPVSSKVWSWLNLAWIAFFAIVGTLNLYVAYQFSESTWVNFKLFGVSALMLLFLLPQVFWLAAKDMADTDSTSITKPTRDG